LRKWTGPRRFSNEQRPNWLSIAIPGRYRHREKRRSNGEVQYASERELAIRNADRESTLLRQVRAALRRIHDGTFGVCVECEYEISPKRLLAVPWASRCIECQDTADRDQQEDTQSFSETIADAA